MFCKGSHILSIFICFLFLDLIIGANTAKVLIKQIEMKEAFSDKSYGCNTREVTAFCYLSVYCFIDFTTVPSSGEDEKQRKEEKL